MGDGIGRGGEFLRRRSGSWTYLDVLWRGSRLLRLGRYALRRFIVSEEHLMKVLLVALRSVHILEWVVGSCMDNC